jgi:pimeloyl-ACP methyl ester carboxylesterase
MAETTIAAERGIRLDASLELPSRARGIVVFAHGSGSSRLSPRNQYVAAVLRKSGRLGTLLFDLLTGSEDATYENRFEIGLLSTRLAMALDWLAEQDGVGDLPVGLFGASTGAAAALVTASARPEQVQAVVSRGGRPDLAAEALADVVAPTLLIVGGNDPVVIALNRRALGTLASTNKKLEIVPGATHLFEEPGALERVASLTTEWFEHFLSGRG